MIGKKYSWWLPELTSIDKAPLWAANKPAPDPDDVDVMACTGLINLMRRIEGLPVPGIKENLKYAGGTGVWYRYLKKKEALLDFDCYSDYPKGTLFIRRYKNVEDQGHVAVLYKESKRGSLYSNLLYCYAYSSEPSSKGTFEPGVTKEDTLGTSHFFNNSGYYEHACLPQDWIFKL